MAKQKEMLVSELTEIALEMCALIVTKGLNIDPEKQGVADMEVSCVFQSQFDQEDIERLTQSESPLAHKACALFKAWTEHQKPYTLSPQLRAEMIEIVTTMRDLGWQSSAKMMGEEGSLPQGDLSIRGGLGTGLSLRP
jgi:hypothetical protein